jgi:hypothetical protein
VVSVSFFKSKIQWNDPQIPWFGSNHKKNLKFCLAHVHYQQENPSTRYRTSIATKKQVDNLIQNVLGGNSDCASIIVWVRLHLKKVALHSRYHVGSKLFPIAFHHSCLLRLCLHSEVAVFSSFWHLTADFSTTRLIMFGSALYSSTTFAQLVLDYYCGIWDQVSVLIDCVDIKILQKIISPSIWRLSWLFQRHSRSKTAAFTIFTR